MAADMPNDLDVVRKDAKLTAALMAFMKRTFCDENFFFYFDKGNNEALYEKYLSSKAPRQVNLPGKMIAGFDKLGGAGDWDNKIWPRLIKAAKAEIKKVVKAAKLLGISNIKLLTEAMTAQAVGDKKTALKLFGELAKKEKLKDDAERLMKALTKAGLA